MPEGPDVTRAGNVRESRHGVDFAGRPIAYPATSQRQEIPFTKNSMGFTECPTCDKPDIYDSTEFEDDTVGCLSCGMDGSEMTHEEYIETLESQGRYNLERGIPSYTIVDHYSAINNREWAGVTGEPYPPEGEEMFDPKRDKLVTGESPYELGEGVDDPKRDKFMMRAR